MGSWKISLFIAGFLSVLGAAMLPHSVAALEQGAVSRPLVLAPLMNVAAETPTSFDETPASAFEVQQVACGGESGAIISTPKVARAQTNPAYNFAIGIPFIDATDVIKGTVTGLLEDMIICPMISGLFTGVQVIMNVLITTNLYVEPLLVNGATPTGSEQNSGIYASWRAFRDFANVFLAFGVIAIVLSQATSMGLSAYGIKKLLPKVILAAILINLSYFLCAVLIDVFNLLGGTLGSTLMAAINASMGASNTSLSEQMNSSVEVLALVAFFNPAMWIMFLLIFLVLLIIGFCALFFLAARQVMIALLVVIAPLAFAAWMLPNTESYFKKWWSVFIKLLAIYPVVSVLVVITYILLIAIGSQLNDPTTVEGGSDAGSVIEAGGGGGGGGGN